MAVRILTGRAGRLMPLLLQEIAQARREGLRALVLVPEQFTLLAEREIMDGLELPGLMDIEVLSPSRLRRDVFERGGRPRQSLLDDRGRRMALSQALLSLREELQYYQGAADTPGLPEKLAALLGDMKKAGLTAQRLEEHAQALPPGAAQAKEMDVSRLWAAYDRLLAGRFVDGESAQEELIRRLPDSGVVSGAAVWVYGFDVLTRPMCALLAVVGAEADRLTVTLAMDAREAEDGRIFRAQQCSAVLLRKTLDMAGIAVQEVRAPRPPLPAAPALQWLESRLFAPRREPYAEETDALEIRAAANPFAEALAVCAWLWLERDRGVPWTEMAVALADPAAYGPVLSMALRASGVPFYMGEKLPAQQHGLVRMLLAALRCCAGGWAQEDVLAVMKSGFSPLTEEEAFALENYALENGIRGAKWDRPFTRGQDAAAMEPLRLRLMEPLRRLRLGLRQARDAQSSMTAVFTLLQDVDAYERLKAREARLLAEGMQAEAAQNRQVWRMILETLEQQRELLDGSRAPMQQVAAWLAAGFTSAEIHSLPPTPDTVTVGEVGHMALESARSLAVMGMQDTGAAAQRSLLTEGEREQLSAWHGYDVGLSAGVQQSLRQSDFYRTFALARERLLLTHAQSTQDGDALRPGNVLLDVKELFPLVREQGGVQEQEEPVAPRTALNGLAPRLRAAAEGTPLEEALPLAWRQAFAWLWNRQPYAEALSLALAHLDARTPAPPLEPKKAWRLFGRDAVSISRLEEFAACPYRHFVHYGLSPVERRNFTFQADDRGDFFHAALSAFVTVAAQTGAWPERMEEAGVNAVMDEVVAPLMAQWTDGPLGEDARSRALGRRYVETVKRAAWLFTRHMRNSRFTTQGTEVAFGEPGGLPPVVLELADGSQVALRGKIDRIDRYEGDQGVYLRVVDYKSSPHRLEPSRMWYGLQLQLLLYLKAATAGGAGEPAGAFYFTVSDPMCDAAQDLKAAAEAAIAKELRLKGVVLADAEVIAAMDAEEPGFSLEKVFNADGAVSRNASAVDRQEMAALLNRAQKLAAQLAGEIRGGKIAAQPAALGDWSACAYCEYRSICGLDPRETDAQRKLPEISKEEFRSLLANEGKTPEAADRA